MSRIGDAALAWFAVLMVVWGVLVAFATAVLPAVLVWYLLTH